MSMKKSFLLGLLFGIFIYANVFAQNYDETKLEALTNEFIQKSESSDALSLMTTIRSYYSSLSVGDKDKILTYYLNKTTALLQSEEKNEALAVIHLYQNFADSKDSNLPNLLYIKGCLYAEKVDSFQLKRTIDELNNLTGLENVQTRNYVSQLNSSLNKIRNFIPSYKTIEGAWIADDLCWNTSNKEHYLVGAFEKMEPDIILNVNYDQVGDTASWCLDKECFLSSQVVAHKKMAIWSWDVKNYASQIVIPYSSDSIYVLWSSEKINKNGITYAGVLRETTGAASAMINAELAQNNKYDFSDQLIGGLATSIAEIGINSIIDALFTPSKKMFVLEAHLKIVNKYLMRGSLIYKYSKVKADGNSKYHEYCSNVTLVRWLPDSKIAFIGQPNNEWGPITHPQWNLTTKEYKKDKTTRFSDYYNNVCKRYLLPFVATRYFNKDQIKGLMIFNDSILQKQNFKGEYAIKRSYIPYCGFDYSDVDQKTISKFHLQNQGYTYITNITEGSPAYIAGLKKDDIVISVNGKSINSKGEMNSCLLNTHIGDWLYFNVLRGSKYLNFTLRVTWK